MDKDERRFVTFSVRPETHRFDIWDKKDDHALNLFLETFRNDITPKDAKKHYRRMKSVAIDSGENPNRFFRYGNDALSYMVKEFEANRSEPSYFNVFHDHRFHTVESMMGRIIDMQLIEGSRARKLGVDAFVEVDAVLDKRHPLTERADMFKSMSAGIITGKVKCERCSKPFYECRCEKANYAAHEATLVELSFVTIPAYKNAKVIDMESYSALPKSPYEMFSDSTGVDERIADKIAERVMQQLSSSKLSFGEAKADHSACIPAEEHKRLVEEHEQLLTLVQKYDAVLQKYNEVISKISQPL